MLIGIDLRIASKRRACHPIEKQAYSLRSAYQRDPFRPGHGITNRLTSGLHGRGLFVSANTSLIAGRFTDFAPSASCVGGGGCLAIRGESFNGFLVGNTGVGLGYYVSSGLANYIRIVVGYQRQ